MKTIKIWDAPVRIFHWFLAIVFSLSAYSAFQDKFGIWADVHTNSGLTVLSLVLWRIVWGVIGSETARFSTFVKRPKSVISFLRESKSGAYLWAGHNPLAALSVVFMVLLLLVQPVLGLFSSDDLFFSGPLAKYRDSLPFRPTLWHERLGLFLIGFVIFHIAVTFGYLLIKKINLIQPMITGKRTVPDTYVQPDQQPWIKAAVIFAIIAAVVFMFLG